MTRLSTVTGPRGGAAARAAARLATLRRTEIHSLARYALEKGAVNLALGAPDFPPDPAVVAAARAAIRDGSHQYSDPWGAPATRRAIAAAFERWHGVAIDPETEVTVTCGVTEGFLAALFALAHPGDEVVLFEPFFESYIPPIQLAGLVPRFVRLRPPDWRWDPDELAEAIDEKTAIILVNSPSNPAGTIFGRDELRQVATLCERWDVVCLSDEVYEHLVFDGSHTCALGVDGLRHRAVVLSGLSKSLAVTGWRIGWTAGAAHLTSAIRQVHELVTACAPNPLQQAAARLLDGLPADFYATMRSRIASGRHRLCAALAQAGLTPTTSRGGYFVLADIRPLGRGDDRQAVLALIDEAGVAAVPGGRFFSRERHGGAFARFCFAKSEETLARAELGLGRLANRRRARRAR